MTVQEVGNELVALVRAGKFEEAVTQFYADSIVSVEAVESDAAAAKGIAAIRAKGEWWYANHEVHGVEVTDPLVNNDQFAATLRIDLTEKANGKRSVFEEIAVYTVENGKIVHERFFYNF